MKRSINFTLTNSLENEAQTDSLSYLLLIELRTSFVSQIFSFFSLVRQYNDEYKQRHKVDHDAEETILQIVKVQVQHNNETNN
jgi:hypothetical protein